MQSAAPAVTACLIVRDEAVRLAASLAAVSAFVDEIVVCDTGSSDDTIEVARRFGARVVTAEWTDDFAAARNTALAACRTPWVLSLDADEVSTGRPALFAPLLAACEREIQALAIRIDNASGPDARGLTSHSELKLFRPEHCRWVGRVHEQLVDARGDAPRSLGLPPEALRLVHHGYVDPLIVRAKAVRNARLCALELDQALDAAVSVRDIARAAFDLGRSYLACGEAQLAGPPLHLCRGLSGGLMWQWSTDFLIQLTLAEGRTTDAIGLIDQLARTGAPAGYCLWLTARAAMQAHDLVAAAELLAAITELEDLSGNQLAMDAVEQARLVCSDRGRVEALAA